MNPLLFASLAFNILAIIAGLVLLVKLATARETADDLREDLADARKALREADDLNASLFTELNEFRAAKAKRLANLSRGTPKPKLVA